MASLADEANHPALGLDTDQQRNLDARIPPGAMEAVSKTLDFSALDDAAEVHIDSLDYVPSTVCALKRKDLMKLAKKHGFKSNAKSTVLVAQLTELYRVSQRAAWRRRRRFALTIAPPRALAVLVRSKVGSTALSSGPRRFQEQHKTRGAGGSGTVH